MLSIVICSYNRASYITGALGSLYAGNANLNDFEVVFVDNNSTDNSLQIANDWRALHPNGNFILTSEIKQGASYARNTGANLAKGQWLCFMDDDAVAFPDFVQNILKHINTYPERVGFGGRIIPKYLPNEPSWMSYYVSSMVGHFHYSETYTPFKNGKYPLESNMIVRKDIYDQVGGFNEALPGVVGTVRIGGEGKALFYSIMKLGHTIYYDPSIVVHHIVETKKLTPTYLYNVASGMGRGEKTRTLSIGKISYIKKIVEYLIKLGAAIVLGLGYTIKGNPQQFWPIVKFRIDTLKGLIGL
jgi:glycosyltransferase involved in cell wall biosynthesis